MFWSEVFGVTAKNVRLHDDVIKGAIPYMLKLSISEKNFIKTEVGNILEEFTVACCFDVSVVTLCEHSFDKNFKLAENTFITLRRMVNNIGENLPKLNFDSLKALMITLAKIIDSAKKGNMKTWAQEICISMIELFGIENYYSLIQNTLGEQRIEYAKILVKTVEEKAKKNNKRESNIGGFINEVKD